jgi:uncharacterized protein YggE
MADDNTDPQQRAIEIALAQAKRVSRESRLVVQALARIRDGEYTPQPKEAQEHERSNRSTT